MSTVEEEPEELAPLRGDLADTASMEILQIGYLHAVAAAAKCSIATPQPDKRLDWIITHQSSAHTAGDNEATLKVALKSTTQVAANPTGGTFPFTIKNDHLEYLNYSDPIVNRIMVVMLLPPDIDNWIRASGDYLELRHCCYWVNLSGFPISGKGRTTVRVPVGQVFDDHALCGIMACIGSGGRP
ncbi:DUF4365 domain-containing protein [Amycolatopsis sp. CA-230715]|uniref:DUF4365 domain-containing protein n=1 Tax=Amycolatopsis sp. CA-230715 TaxID=2745196 RepID=UPI001C01743C|nr:DUF4365 domain-containing protein [Amycolatopsis sp. CA-230715]